MYISRLAKAFKDQSVSIEIGSYYDAIYGLDLMNQINYGFVSIDGIGYDNRIVYNNGIRYTKDNVVVQIGKEWVLTNGFNDLFALGTLANILHLVFKDKQAEEAVYIFKMDDNLQIYKRKGKYGFFPLKAAWDNQTQAQCLEEFRQYAWNKWNDAYMNKLNTVSRDKEKLMEGATYENWHKTPKTFSDFVSLLNEIGIEIQPLNSINFEYRTTDVFLENPGSMENQRLIVEEYMKMDLSTNNILDKQALMYIGLSFFQRNPPDLISAYQINYETNTSFCTKLTQVNTSNPYILGQIKEIKKEYQGALEYYKQGAKNSIESLIRYVVLLFKQTNKQKQAFDWLHELSRCDHPLALYEYGKILFDYFPESVEYNEAACNLFERCIEYDIERAYRGIFLLKREVTRKIMPKFYQKLIDIRLRAPAEPNMI